MRVATECGSGEDVAVVVQSELGSEPFAGQTTHVPRGVVHSSRNVGQRPGRRILLFSPAGMERFFLQTGAPTPDAEIDATAALSSAARHGWVFV